MTEIEDANFRYRIKQNSEGLIMLQGDCILGGERVARVEASYFELSEQIIINVLIDQRLKFSHKVDSIKNAGFNSIHSELASHSLKTIIKAK